MNRMTIKAVFLLFLLPLAAGCGGTSGGGNGRSLSEVAVVDDDDGERRRGEGRSRKKIEDGERSGKGAYDYHTDEGDDSGSLMSGVVASLFTGGGDGGGTASAREDSIWAHKRWCVGYRQSWIYPAGDTLARVDRGTLILGRGPWDHWFFHLGAYYGNGELGRPDLTGIRSPREMGIEAGGRYYFTSDHTFLGAYLSFNLGLGAAIWNYTDPVPVTTEEGGTAFVDSDDLGLYTGAVGIGFSLVQTRHFHLGAGAMTGFRMYATETTEGFSNDLFKDVGYLQWHLEGFFRF